MYLRLKHSASDPSKSARQPHRPTLSRRVYDTLVAQNMASFDWQYGGQPGPIKFVDCHQFEYAATRAANGDHLAGIMINLYLNGIGRLVVPAHGGVCQYSIGLQWNNRNTSISLAGQAVAMQALAVGAQLRRRATMLNIGLGIHRFVRVNARRMGLHAPAAASLDVFHAEAAPMLRDTAWYATALHQFALAYEVGRLRQDADEMFDAIVGVLDQAVPTTHFVGMTAPKLRLDEAVAVLAAYAYFAADRAETDSLRTAATQICEIAPRHAQPHGGYSQVPDSEPDSDLPVDIDCTIDLVRACMCVLQHIPERRLECIVNHGKRALFDPAIALARRPESGILLVVEAAAKIPPAPNIAIEDAAFSPA